MKKVLRWLGAGAVAASMMMAVACSPSSGGGKTPATTAEANAYLSVMINPTVEMTLDDNGKVLTFAAGNDDAAVLLSGVDLTGMTAEEATKLITQLATDMGFIDDVNKTVKVIASADDAAAEDKIEAEAAAGATAVAADIGIEHSARTLEKELARLQKADPVLYADLTVAKLRLIKTVMQFDKTITVDTGVAMTVTQLTEALSVQQVKYGKFLTKDLKAQYKALEEKSEYETEKKIAAIYGERYAALFEQEHALDEMEDRFEEALENRALSEADVTAIAEALQLADTTALAGEDGAVTADSIEEYLDRYEDVAEREGEEAAAAFEQAEETIETILEAYEEDEAGLTQAMKDELTALIGENTVNTLDELEEYADTIEEEMETIEEETELTAEQKAEIKALEKAEDAVEDAIKEQLKDELKQVKDELAALKQQMLDEAKTKA